MKKYLDKNLSFEERAKALVSEMTLEEKVSQIISSSPAIERLNIPAYDWWNDAIHGVARAGIATVFPQSIAMAATWNIDLMYQMGKVISDEYRAKHNEALREGHIDKYLGINTFSPNINILRDPRWGRGQETYGECPTLTSEMGKAYIKSVQGEGKYLKVACCAKHYAVHSGPESIRLEFENDCSDKDLWETYLPAFETAIVEAKCENIMPAYNKFRGKACCQNDFFLKDILKDKWGFKGHVITDAGAVYYLIAFHKDTDTMEEASSLAIKGGSHLDLCYPNFCFNTLPEAVKKGLISEKEITQACEKVMTTRFRLGLFADDCEFDSIPFSVVDCKEHRNLALKCGEESVVLLKNNGVLPIKKNSIKRILVVGPNADSKQVNCGNYSGTPSKQITILEGIRNYVGEEAEVYYCKGCNIGQGEFTNCVADEKYGFYEAISYGKRSDLIIFVGGLNSTLEGENGDASNSDSGGDRTDIKLPGCQDELIETLSKLRKPLIVLALAGGPVALNTAQEKANAVLQGMYLGEEAGTAFANILFGECSPSGKLPYTVPYSVEDLPPIEDYRMENRTYRYSKKEPLYPFGYGLSYSEFEYSNLRCKINKNIEIKVNIKNIGNFKAKEITQVYVSLPDAPCRVPNIDLKSFCKNELSPGETKELIFTIKPLTYIDMDGSKQQYKGKAVFTVGSGQGNMRSKILGIDNNIKFDLIIKK